MKAAFIETIGPPNVIRVDDVPDPVCGVDEVLIAGQYAAVNPIDCYIRSGKVALNLPRPYYIVGCDLAGQVVETGAGVQGFKVGDRVWTSNQGFFGRQGTFSQLFAAKKSEVFPIENGVDPRLATACGLVGITAFVGLFEKAKLMAGETVFVRGGAGAVGTMVVQMARRCGAHVITSTGSPEKVRLCLERGAQHAFNYHDVEWADAVRELAPSGVDVYWDTSREPDLEKSCGVMRDNGRIILMAGRDARAVLPVGVFYAKQLSIHGLMVLKATPNEVKRAADQINRWLAAKQLTISISKVLPLSETVIAHQLQEAATIGLDNRLSGKIVVDLN